MSPGWIVREQGGRRLVFADILLNIWNCHLNHRWKCLKQREKPHFSIESEMKWKRERETRWEFKQFSFLSLSLNSLSSIDFNYSPFYLLSSLARFSWTRFRVLLLPIVGLLDIFSFFFSIHIEGNYYLAIDIDIVHTHTHIFTSPHRLVEHRLERHVQKTVRTNADDDADEDDDGDHPLRRRYIKGLLAFHSRTSSYIAPSFRYLCSFHYYCPLQFVRVCNVCVCVCVLCHLLISFPHLVRDLLSLLLYVSYIFAFPSCWFWFFDQIYIYIASLNCLNWFRSPLSRTGTLCLCCCFVLLVFLFGFILSLHIFYFIFTSNQWCRMKNVDSLLNISTSISSLIFVVVFYLLRFPIFDSNFVY